MKARVAFLGLEDHSLAGLSAAGETPYDEFQAKADREIPVVVLQPGEA